MYQNSDFHLPIDPAAGLREQKRIATRARIAAAAAELATADGLENTGADQIAAAAEVGRATFFRYFSSKEHAVAEGMNARWLNRIVAALDHQPADYAAAEAVVAAFAELAHDFDDISGQIRELATMERSSPALRAWGLGVYAHYEGVIAGLISPRIRDLRQPDPRPRLIGALAMSSVRIALDDWLAHGGSLPDRVQQALRSITVVDTGVLRESGSRTSRPRVRPRD